jgi:hypothetical protein
MFPKLETWFSELFGKLKVMAMNILPNWAQKLLGFGESMTSVASTQPESLATSIEDGVIQDGKVITTSPEDFLIATKNPSDLISSVGGGVNISMDSVIAELRELKAAFLSNKDVYMDSTKVTSAVSKVVGKTTKNQYI